MEQEGIALYPEIFPVVIIAQHLAGRYEDKSSLLVIIIMPSVPQVSAFQVLQENGIEPVSLADMPQRRDPGKINDADQRVQRFLPQKGVVVPYGIHVQNNAHALSLLFTGA